MNELRNGKCYFYKDEITVREEYIIDLPQTYQLWIRQNTKIRRQIIIFSIELKDVQDKYVALHRVSSRKAFTKCMWLKSSTALGKTNIWETWKKTSVLSSYALHRLTLII